MSDTEYIHADPGVNDLYQDEREREWNAVWREFPSSLEDLGYPPRGVITSTVFYAGSFPELPDFTIAVLGLGGRRETRPTLTSLTDRTFMGPLVKNPARIAARHTGSGIAVVGNYHADGSYTERITGTEALTSASALQHTIWPALKYLRKKQLARHGGRPPRRSSHFTDKDVEWIEAQPDYRTVSKWHKWFLERHGDERR